MLPKERSTEDVVPRRDDEPARSLETRIFNQLFNVPSGRVSDPPFEQNAAAGPVLPRLAARTPMLPVRFADVNTLWVVLSAAGSAVSSRVSDRNRTGDLQGHNLAL